MDNAVEALQYAFAMLVFVIALSVIIPVFSQAKETSDMVFYMTDKRSFYEEVQLSDEELNQSGRIVGIETIVPSLYRNYKENYVVEFYNSNRELMLRFDLSEENRTRQIWTGNPNIDVKKRLDLFLNGGTNGKGIINNQIHDLKTDIAFAEEITPTVKENIVKHGLYDYCKGRKFVEEYAYVPKDITEITQETSKIVIRYIELV